MSNLADDVASHRWYHTIDLPGGVVTPGMFDTRKSAKQLPWPDSFAGKRCLDVGTSDGFWAFEMERRGADEVVAIDLIDPSRRDTTRGAGLVSPLSEGEVSRQTQTFALAHKALGSKVEWRNLSVYDLSADLVGTFDFVYMGTILVHLRDPVAALSAVRSVTRGQLLNYEAVSLSLSVLHPRTPVTKVNAIARADWWLPNIACLRRWTRAAGFTTVRAGTITYVGRRGAKAPTKLLLRHPISTTMLKFVGMPHSWVLSRSA